MSVAFGLRQSTWPDHSSSPAPPPQALRPGGGLVAPPEQGGGGTWTVGPNLLPTRKTQQSLLQTQQYPHPSFRFLNPAFSHRLLPVVNGQFSPAEQVGKLSLGGLSPAKGTQPRNRFKPWFVAFHVPSKPGSFLSLDYCPLCLGFGDQRRAQGGRGVWVTDGSHCRTTGSA